MRQGGGGEIHPELGNEIDRCIRVIDCLKQADSRQTKMSGAEREYNKQDSFPQFPVFDKNKGSVVQWLDLIESQAREDARRVGVDDQDFIASRMWRMLKACALDPASKNWLSSPAMAQFHCQSKDDWEDVREQFQETHSCQLVDTQQLWTAFLTMKPRRMSNADYVEEARRRAGALAPTGMISVSELAWRVALHSMRSDDAQEFLRNLQPKYRSGMDLPWNEVKSAAQASDAIFNHKRMGEVGEKRKSAQDTAPRKRQKTDQKKKSNSKDPFCKRCNAAHPFGQHTVAQTADAGPKLKPTNLPKKFGKKCTVEPGSDSESDLILFKERLEPFQPRKIGRIKLSSNNQAEGPTEIIIPVNIHETNQQFPADVQVRALIDTGSYDACINFAKVRELGINYEAAMQVVELAVDGVTGMSYGFCTLDITCGDAKATNYRCYIIDVNSNDYDMIINIDLALKLGAEFKIPDPMASRTKVSDTVRQSPVSETETETQKQSEQEEDDFAVWETRMLCEQPLPEVDRSRIWEAIRPCLQENANIPSGTFCNLEESILYLPAKTDQPVFRRQYDVPIPLQPLVDKRLEEYLQEGIIMDNNYKSQYNSPIVVAPKKDNEGIVNDIRFCFDARALNNILEDDNFLLPKVRDLFEKVQGFRVCSRLDLKHGYHQLLVNEDDRNKTAFTWKSRQYVFIGAPFGIKTIPAHFQRTMQRVLREWDHCVVVFIDDILVFSDSVRHHIRDLKGVINTLTKANLRLRPEKCEFGLHKVRLLGHILSGMEISADPRKISAFCQMERPTTGKEMQSFLGAANYLRDYIPSYAKITAPLEPLRFAKDVQSEWDDECEKAFQALKEVLSSAPVLSVPRADRPFNIQTDASQAGVGAVLYQLDEDNNPKYICFASSALRKGQRNYPATKRELLGIIFALKTFRRWLLGGPKFKLYTDHRALQYLFNNKSTSQYMLENWSFVLAEYDFDVFHRPGIELVLPDTLSRLYYLIDKDRSDFQPKEVMRSNYHVPKKRKATQQKAKSMISEPENQLKVGAQRVTRQNAESVTFPADLREAQATEAPMVERASRTKPSINFRRYIRDVLNKTDPGSDSDRRKIIDHAHKQGHEATDGLFKKLWYDGYYWKGMRRMCQEFAMACEECLMYNIGKAGYHPLRPIAATNPCDHLAMDHAEISRVSKNGYRFILVVVDIASRFVWLRAAKDRAAITVAKELYQICCEFGLPKILQSDNAKEYASQVIAELKRICGFDHRFISTYHARANGAAEAHVKLVKTLLNKYMKGDYSEWEVLVPATQFMLNQRIWNKNETRPFEMMFARPANLFQDFTKVESRLLTPQQLRKDHEKILKLVYPALRKKVDRANRKQTDSFKQKKGKIIPKDRFAVGTTVYVKNEFASRKTDPKYLGPFKIVSRKGGVYYVKDYTGAISEKKYPPSKLKLAGKVIKDIPPITAIVNHRGEVNNRHYLAVFEGLTARLWFPVSAVSHVQNLIDAYWERYLLEEADKQDDGDSEAYIPPDYDIISEQVALQSMSERDPQAPRTVGRATRHQTHLARSQMITLSDSDGESEQEDMEVSDVEASIQFN
jgi:transposase InsO family protein